MKPDIRATDSPGTTPQSDPGRSGVSRRPHTPLCIRRSPRKCPESLVGRQGLEPRSVPKFSPPSRRPPVVVLKEAPQPFSTADGTIHVGPVARLLDELVVEPLVVALKVVVIRVFPHGFPKVALAQWNDLGQTLGLDGANESLRVSVRIGAVRRELHGLHAGGLEKRYERGRFA